jgi:hypothetical protein
MADEISSLKILVTESDKQNKTMDKKMDAILELLMKLSSAERKQGSAVEEESKF